MEYFQNMDVGKVSKCFQKPWGQYFKKIQDCKHNYFERREYGYEKQKAYSNYFQ